MSQEVGNHLHDGLVWYTDGSKMCKGTGAGVHGSKPRCDISVLLGQDYLFGGPADTQFLPYQQNQNQFLNPSDILPFRQSPSGFQPVDQSSFLPRDLQSHDLQTSDLPLHLQQTLPQYRFTTNEPQFQKNSPFQYNFQNQVSNRVVNTPVGFRPPHTIKPTTLRPNYSHLFAKSHGHDPSQTETFLGQITLQNPIETPPQYNEFKPSQSFPKTQEITSNSFTSAQEDIRSSKLNENSIQLGARPSFLNHRTRIFAPDTSKKTTRPQIKDYFVNNNGDVFITTKIPFSPKPTTPTHAPTTVARKNNFSPSTKSTGKPLAFNIKSEKKGFVPKNLPPKSLDIEPLLEEPIKENKGVNDDDDVEVIQSKDEEYITLPPPVTEPTTTDKLSSNIVDKHVSDIVEEHASDIDDDTNINEHVNENADEQVGNVNDEHVSEVANDHVGDVADKHLSDIDDELVSDVHHELSSEVTDGHVSGITDEHVSDIANKQTNDIPDNHSVESIVQNITSTASPTEAVTESEELTTYYEEETEKVPTEYNYSEEVYDSLENEKEYVSNENDIQDDEYSENQSGEVLNSEEKEDNVEEKELEELKVETTTTTSKKPNSTDEVTTTPSNTYELITMKPTTIMKEMNFHDFDDTMGADTTEAQSSIETATIPMTVSMSSSVNIKKGDKIINEHIEEEPEVVISVVTSKTVVNNTIIASATPIPVVTEAVKSTTEASMFSNGDNTTDSWVVVASVQTSRSVSGARYLPSSIVEQDERIKLLNEHSEEDISKEDSSDNSKEKMENKTKVETTTNEEETTLLPTSTKARTSTESLIDKLDRVQSDLSSGLLTGGLGNNIAVIKENMPDKLDMTTMVDIASTSSTSTTTKAPYPQVNIRKFSPGNRPTSTKRPRTPVKNDDTTGLLPTGFKPKYQNTRKPGSQSAKDEPQSDEPRKVDISSFLPSGYKLKGSDDKSSKLLEEILSRVKPVKAEETSENKTKDDEITIPLSSDETTTESSIFKNTKLDDLSKFLPPGYKLPKNEEKTTESGILKNTKVDISKFLPPGYKLPKSEEKTTESSILKNTKTDDISKFLPPGYKLPKSEERTTESSVFKNTKSDDISKFLPPGYKVPKNQGTTESSIFKNTKADDVSKFLPPGYKLRSTTQKPKVPETGLPKIKPVNDISSLLPPGYKPQKEESSNGIAQPVDLSALLPPGYKLKPESSNDTTESKINPQNVPTNLLPPGFKEGSTDTSSTTTAKPTGGFKVVFPSRPGGGARKSTSRTTPRTFNDEPAKPTSPTIHKGWPSRATTEFTGWPTPSTTPISIEKLLEAARTAASSTTETIETTVSTSTTTTTTTTTTPKPTTPGVCVDECDLVGTIKLVGGAKWVPELLDRNTKEYQILANEVQSQLDGVYSSSPVLHKWYKKIRIDGFSEGSVLVDYLVELNDLGRQVDTQEMKKLFHESLTDALSKPGANREAKSLNESVKLEGKLSLGNFVVDPTYTDFIVLPKQMYPTVGYAENDVLLPQWAIAVIVIGLASLLFVIIFGVTVLVNRQKNNKKKSPTPLTEDMLNELNKNHMGGFDNYGADDLYNMEDVWNDKGYDQKLPKKRSSGSIHDNSMSNLYDSWRSEWNGYYYNAYYGNNPNNPGSSHSGYNGRRRSDYDTNF